MNSIITKVTRTNLLKNFLKYSFGMLFEKMVLMIVFFYIANLFGAEKYGEITYSMSILTLFSILGVLGLDTYGHREISNNKNKISVIITSHLIFKFLLFFIVESLIFLYIKNFENSNHVRLIILAYSLVIFLDIFNLEWAARGVEKYEPILLSKIISSLMLLVSIFLLLNNESENVYFILIFLFFYKFISGLIYLIKFKEYIVFSAFNFKYLKASFLPSIILMSSYLMVTIYYHIDKVMLGKMANLEYVGMYDVSYKVYGIFVILNTLLWKVFSTRVAQKINLREFQYIMALSGIILMFLMFFSAEILITSILGEQYKETISTTKILSLSVVLVFFNSLMVSPLALWGYEKYFFYLTSLGASINVVINYYLIPIYNMNGAAIATVLSEFFVLVCFIAFFRKKVTI